MLIIYVSNCPILIRLASGFEDAVIEAFSWIDFLWQPLHLILFLN